MELTPLVSFANINITIIFTNLSNSNASFVLFGYTYQVIFLELFSYIEDEFA